MDGDGVIPTSQSIHTRGAVDRSNGIVTVVRQKIGFWIAGTEAGVRGTT